ncbi:unnamed protein product [Rotaria sp. Silwood1]|nr:unnamed protein product [Rotaria sp. Silwood1]
MAQCETPFEPIEGQDIVEKHLILRAKPIMDLTQNNETKLDRQKRGFCCSGRDWRCCCMVHGFECTVKGNGYGCDRIRGDWDCKGCSHGWRC